MGVIINDKLTWDNHKTYIKKKISRNLGILYKCRRIMDKNDLLGMYNCFVLPYLLYCLPVWGGSVNKDDIIVKIQNRVLRVICKTKRSEEAWKLSNDSVLPINILYSLEIAKFCYKHSENILPTTFSDIIMPDFISDTHNINTKQSKCRNYHLKTSDFLPLIPKSFHVNCIKLWNKIPLALKQQRNIYKFIDELRKHYLLKAMTKYTI